MNIGFVGLGAMGRPIVVNLIDLGHELVVCDTDETRTATLAQRGATVAGSAREVADTADVVLACMPNLDAAEAVAIGVDGVLGGSQATAFVNLGTTGSAYSRDVAAKMAETSKAFLDAPISGGPPGAEAGSLGIMCSGDKATFEALKPALEGISGKLVYLNDKPGAAQTMKLVNNIISFGNISVALEAMTLGAKAGLDPEQMLEVINASSGRNSATETKIPNHVLNRNFDYGGAMYIIEKDLDLWRREAEAYQAPMWLGTNIRTLFMQCIAEVGRDADLTELTKTLEKMAGVELPKTR
ncbi:MAG: NAD(P)-dependent oxidoreductase [Alphaproteobacteria bacterium]|jgi:3-hydroxyisobutyrate dehydrogenase-like beta-hydroxyacid dehydrogenase|nr:NAD(P)-dependent oxidoreductase [Alphaproteobacteria bacterium]